MIVDHPGIDHPELQAAEDVDRIDSMPMLGIEVEGDAYASAMEKMMYSHAWLHSRVPGSIEHWGADYRVVRSI